MSKKNRSMKTKTAGAAKAKREPKANRLGKRAQIFADAQAGKLPSPPDFSAPTHKFWVARLNEVVALAKAGDVAKLKRFALPDYSSSPRAIAKFRDLCVTALLARAAAK